MVMPTVRFPQFSPDLTALGTGVSSILQNVVPRVDGYGPFRSILPFTRSLPAPCRGYFFARKSDGTIVIFAGTATDLYMMSNTDFSWSNVSQPVNTYGTLPASNNWQFAQFNDTVIAVQVNTIPQKLLLGTDATFIDLPGNPPNAGSVAVVNFFLVLTELLSNPRRVQWSDLGGITTWTPGVGQSDFQDLSDGGSCHAVRGGDAYGTVFQDAAIRTFTYAPGSAAVFQITRIAEDDGIYARYMAVNAGSITYFRSPQGFKMIQPGGIPVGIGKGRVDDFFAADVDTANLQLCIASSDPTSTRVFFGYKSSQGAAGLIDKILIFDPTVGQNGSWSIVVGQSLEYIASLAKPGLTLEGLDAIAPAPLNVLGVADNGAGKVRLTLDAVQNAKFQIAGQNFIIVYNVQGGPAAINGKHFLANVVVVDPTHVDLTDVAYSAGYTGGGAIGGSLDALPFSLDDVSLSALAQLSGITSLHAIGFFSGSFLEAILETDEQDSDGQLIFVGEGMIPLTDCQTVFGSFGFRNTAQAATVYTTEQQVNIRGWCPGTFEGRYAKARLRMPAGSIWTYARAVQPDVQPAGDT